MIYTCLPEEYESIKCRVMLELSDAQSVALTSDGWTSFATKSYLTVTAHLINSEFCVVARVLNTIEVPESNTAASLSVRLGNIAKNWRIGDDTPGPRLRSSPSQETNGRIHSG